LRAHRIAGDVTKAAVVKDLWQQAVEQSTGSSKTFAKLLLKKRTSRNLNVFLTI